MAAPFCLRPVRASHHFLNSSAFTVRKAVRTLARICDVPYHRQPLTPQLRQHMAASVAQLVEHRSRKAGVTGSSPVAGSIAQDSRLRAAFLLPFLRTPANPSVTPSATPLFKNKSPADHGFPSGNHDQRGSSATSSRESRQHSSAEPRATPPSKRRRAA